MKPISILLLLVLSAAQFLTAENAVTVQIPSDPDLVYLRITAVEGTRNRPMRGLSKEQFRVFEDNTPQEITFFSEDTLPLHVAILLDVSGTIKDETLRSLSTMTRSGSKNDEFLVLENGKVPLNDAVLQALNALEQRGNQQKRALVVITSRKDPGSYPLEKVRTRIKELNIPIYVAALQTGSDLSSDSDRQVLSDLTERTGGAAYFPSLSFEQTEILRKVVAQLKNQYVIGYRTTNRAMDGKWRKVKITGEYLDTETRKIRKMNVLAKTGYYAPTAPK